ncbi:MAG TPA: aminotransferase class I/II-fold pyridoxal phosphate-dependent enzyme [Nocardioides sp.]|uniref:aminotransferase class I/II-fold pyridoxal phosphate-dependent enzyme n=1 Tax=Nocardioides sp. TaxID=35761 RepID=UPI002F4234E8
MWQDVVAAVDDRSAKGIALALSSGIDRGALRAGERLPPIRRVARDLQVAPATISAAWSQLARAGLIETDGRRGTRVREGSVGPRRYRRALDSHAGYRVDLSTGLPDPRLLPDLHAAMQRVPRDETVHSYLEEPVVPALREVLEGSWPNAVESLTIVDGAMDAHSQFVAAHLRFGDRVAVEQPCFPPLLDLLEMAGVVPMGVGYDAEGPVVDDLTRALDAGAKVLFFQPWGQNPSGQSLSASRAEALAAALDGRDVVVVEDDSAGGTPSGSPVSLGTLLPERTVLVRSFSKSHGPDLRLAAVGGPASVVAPIVERRYLGQGWSSRLVQSILLDLLTDPGSRTLVADARAAYALRTGALADALAERGVEVPGGDGINVWIPVAEQGAALLHLAAAGVRAASGDPFWISSPASDRIRITTATLDDSDLGDLPDVIAAAARAGSWSGHR